MDNIEIITYATHSEGTFEEIKNNKFNIPITVLGWGKKWNGFMQKFEDIYKHMEKLPDNKIIFFIDGFDVTINKDLKTIYQTFLDLNAKIVISKNPYSNYFMTRIFKTCQNNIVGNSGLYCGYNKYLKQFLKFILERSKSVKDDDQRIMNESCAYFDIKLDTDQKLFHNLTLPERYFNNKKFDACFLATPGKLSFDRISRMPREYIKYLWKDLLVILATILFANYYYNKFENKYNCHKYTSIIAILISIYFIIDTNQFFVIIFFVIFLVWHSKHLLILKKMKNKK